MDVSPLQSEGVDMATAATAEELGGGRSFVSGAGGQHEA